MAKRPKRSGSTSGGSNNPMKGLEKLTEKLISTTTQELTKVQDAIQNTANAASSSLGSPSPSPTASKSGLLDKAMLALSFKNMDTNKDNTNQNTLDVQQGEDAYKQSEGMYSLRETSNAIQTSMDSTLFNIYDQGVKLSGIVTALSKDSKERFSIDTSARKTADKNKKSADKESKIEQNASLRAMMEGFKKLKSSAVVKGDKGFMEGGGLLGGILRIGIELLGVLGKGMLMAVSLGGSILKGVGTLLLKSANPFSKGKKVSKGLRGSKVSKSLSKVKDTRFMNMGKKVVTKPTGLLSKIPKMFNMKLLGRASKLIKVGGPIALLLGGLVAFGTKVADGGYEEQFAQLREKFAKLQPIFDSIGGLWESITTGFTDYVMPSLDWIGDIVNKFFGFLGDSIMTSISMIGSQIMNTVLGIYQIFSGDIVKGLKTIFMGEGGPVDMILGFFKKIGTWISDMLGKAWETIKDYNPVDAISSWWSGDDDKKNKNLSTDDTPANLISVEEGNAMVKAALDRINAERVDAPPVNNPISSEQKGLQDMKALAVASMAGSGGSGTAVVTNNYINTDNSSHNQSIGQTGAKVQGKTRRHGR